MPEIPPAADLANHLEGAQLSIVWLPWHTAAAGAMQVENFCLYNSWHHKSKLPFTLRKKTPAGAWLQPGKLSQAAESFAGFSPVHTPICQRKVRTARRGCDLARARQNSTWGSENPASVSTC